MIFDRFACLAAVDLIYDVSKAVLKQKPSGIKKGNGHKKKIN